MIRELASLMPAQNAVIMPTGPAPITVMSRISSSPTICSGLLPFSLMSCDRGLRGDRLPVERVERALHRGRDAGEDGSLGQRVGARLGSPQLLHQIQELARIVRVERHDELLIVEPERVGGVDLDRPVAAADLDVALHDPHPLVRRQVVPVAAPPHPVDDPVAALRPLAGLLLGGAAAADAQPRVLLGFVPTSPAPKMPLLFDLAERNFSYGVTSPTLGAFSKRQMLLDMSQGSRIANHAYPDPLERLDLRLGNAGDGRIKGFRLARKRARDAPGDVVAGLLGSTLQHPRQPIGYLGG